MRFELSLRCSGVFRALDTPNVDQLELPRVHALSVEGHLECFDNEYNRPQKELVQVQDHQVNRVAEVR